MLGSTKIRWPARTNKPNGLLRRCQTSRGHKQHGHARPAQQLAHRLADPPGTDDGYAPLASDWFSNPLHRSTSTAGVNSSSSELQPLFPAAT